MKIYEVQNIKSQVFKDILFFTFTGEYFISLFKQYVEVKSDT